jgi:hypothetical protein
MSMVLPNLLCLGPPKCGTTTLYTVCEKHPDILVPSFKEPHFFVDDKKYKKGLKWYSETYYSKYNNQKYISDFTPGYFANEDAIRRIAADLGTQLKLMYVLRNPAKRAYSHYLHWKRDGLITEPFVDFMRSKAASTIPTTDKLGRIYYDSLYDIHVTNLHKYFPDSTNILSLTFEEDVVNNCALFKEKVSKFLDIDIALFADEPGEVKQNQSQSVSGVGLFFKRIINSENILKRTVKKILPDAVRDKVNNFLNASLNNMFYKETVDLVDNNTFKELNNELFLPSIKRLEVILDRPFNKWYE